MTSAADSNPPKANDGPCTLREAIGNANDHAHGLPEPFKDCPGVPDPTAPSVGNRIKAKLAGTLAMTLVNAQPFDVDSHIIINGPLTIDAGHVSAAKTPGDQRIFRVNQFAHLQLIDLTLKRAFTSGDGAAILAQFASSQLSIGKSTFENNEAKGEGGAIWSAGQALYYDTVFKKHRADRGGAVRVGGTLTNFLKVDMVQNLALLSGGAIECAAPSTTLSLEAVLLEKNQGGIDVQHLKDGDGGGAVRTSCSTSFRGVEATGNEAAGDGGGVMLVNANAPGTTVTRSHFTKGNLAHGLAGMGGGIRSYSKGKFELTRSTIELSFAFGTTGGGGLALDHSPTQPTIIANSTIGENGASEDDQAGASTKGGGLYVKNGNVALVNTTVAFNSGTTAIQFEPTMPGSKLSMQNTVVSGLTALGGTLNCGTANGTITDLGGNAQGPDNKKSCGMGVMELDPLFVEKPFLDWPLRKGQVDLKHYLPTEPLMLGAMASVCANHPQVMGIDQIGNKRPPDMGCSIGAIQQ